MDVREGYLFVLVHLAISYSTRLSIAHTLYVRLILSFFLLYDIKSIHWDLLSAWLGKRRLEGRKNLLLLLLLPYSSSLLNRRQPHFCLLFFPYLFYLV